MIRFEKLGHVHTKRRAQTCSNWPFGLHFVLRWLSRVLRTFWCLSKVTVRKVARPMRRVLYFWSALRPVRPPGEAVKHNVGRCKSIGPAAMLLYGS